MALPLAVDLDGTLIRGDLFIRAIVRFCAARPWNVLTLVAWLARGRAYAKARLTEHCPVDASVLPYDERLLAWLRAERASGRTLVLATAFDRAGADAVAAHLGLFDHVFASDGRTNLKAARKAERLRRAFPGGFVYAGNEQADWSVWRAAERTVIVNATPRLQQRAVRAFEVERVFPRE